MLDVSGYKFKDTEQALLYLKVLMDGLAFFVRDMDTLEAEIERNMIPTSEASSMKLRLQIYRRIFAILTGTAVSGSQFNLLMDQVRRKDFGPISKGA